MTALVTQQPHALRALLDTLGGRDPEQALEQAFVQLARGGDLSLVLAMIKALVRSGLAGIASRLLRSSSSLLSAEPQLSHLAAQLEAMPSGEIPREVIERRVKSHLEQLVQRRPHLTSSLHAVAPGVVRSIRAFTSSKGNHIVIRDGDSSKLDFVFPFADHVAHAASAKLSEPAIGASFLMIGVPSIQLWERVLRMRGQCGYMPSIDIVDTDASVIAIWLGLLSDASIFNDARIGLFIGENALDDYRAFLKHHPDRSLPTNTLTSTRPRWQSVSIEARFFEEVGAMRAERNHRLLQELKQFYAGKDRAHWKQRFDSAAAGGPPLQIVGLTSRFSTVMQHAMRDLAVAFQRRHCSFEVVKQSTDYTGSVDVVGELHRLKPDLIIVINHLRNELRDAIPSNVPYVCWVQDFMQNVWSKQAGASVGELDLVLAHSPAVLASVCGYPRSRLIATHNLTSHDVFSAEPVPAEDLKKYSCDIAYVGHGWETPEQLVEEIQQHNAAFGRYMREVVALTRKRLDDHGCVTTQDLVSIILTAERASDHGCLTPEIRRSMVVPSAQRLIDRILRHQTLEWAAEWAIRHGKQFRVFGNGWNQHARLRSFAGGSVEHGYELRCVYQAAAIHLQVNAYGSLHQRLLDGIASGACMLTRFNPADFIREPHLQIQRFILEHGIGDLKSLLIHAERDPTLRSAVTEAEHLTGTRIATGADPVRAKHVAEHLECASLSPGEFTDEGLFNVLRNLHSIPHRAAGDIPGFASAVFRTKPQLHEMLDRLSGDARARAELSSKMRASVLEHDTYDSLVSVILDVWRSA